MQKISTGLVFIVSLILFQYISQSEEWGRRRGHHNHHYKIDDIVKDLKMDFGNFKHTTKLLNIKNAHKVCKHVKGEFPSDLDDKQKEAIAQALKKKYNKDLPFWLGFKKQNKWRYHCQRSSGSSQNCRGNLMTVCRIKEQEKQDQNDEKEKKQNNKTENKQEKVTKKAGNESTEKIEKKAVKKDAKKDDKKDAKKDVKKDAKKDDKKYSKKAVKKIDNKAVKKADNKVAEKAAEKAAKKAEEKAAKKHYKKDENKEDKSKIMSRGRGHRKFHKERKSFRKDLKHHKRKYSHTSPVHTVHSKRGLINQIKKWANPNVPTEINIYMNQKSRRIENSFEK